MAARSTRETSVGGGSGGGGRSAQQANGFATCTVQHLILFKKLSPDLLFLRFLFSEVHLLMIAFWTAAAQWGMELISYAQINQYRLFKEKIRDRNDIIREHVILF